MKPKSVLVFASGQGTNFRALCQRFAQNSSLARIDALITNICGAGACEVARAFGIPVIEVPHQGMTRTEHEKKILDAIQAYDVDWIILAGYMRLFTAGFIEEFWDSKKGASRITNVHPSLLPAFPGGKAYAQAIEYGVKITGITVHLVGYGIDDGPIVAQQAFEVHDQDTEQTLRERGSEVEHRLYPETVLRLLSQDWEISLGTDGKGRPRVVFK